MTRVFLFWPGRKSMFAKRLKFIAYALIDCFRDLGFEAHLINRRVSKYNLTFRADDILVSPKALPVAVQRGPGYKIFWNLEPLPINAQASKHLGLVCRGYQLTSLQHVDCFWSYDARNAEWLGEQTGKPTQVVPMGYHESFEVTTTDPLPKAVYLLGNVNNRRRGVLARCDAQAMRFGRENRGVERLLRAPGVHLNIYHRRFCRVFDSIRVIVYLLSNQRFVLSEAPWWSPLQAGTHWVTGPGVGIEGLPELCTYYLEHAEERRAIARAGYDFIRQSFTMRGILRDALKGL